MMPIPFGRLLVFSAASAVTACGLQAAPAGPVTFARDVAPIVFERCAVCHHPNGSAPFSLLTYATARPHATQIAAVTRTRVMPPWKSEPGYGDFIGHRPLTDGEIRVLQSVQAYDAGTVINPMQARGQVEGGERGSLHHGCSGNRAPEDDNARLA